MTEQKTPARRRFLTGAAVAAGAMAAPMIAKAQAVTSLRFQSTWPAKDIFHEMATDFAKKVNDMAGGELKIEVLPAGSVVPAFGLFEAISKGTLDGGHGILGYHYGKQNALALWNSGPMFGMDAHMLLAWHKYGGGQQLLNKLYASIGGNVVSFLCGPMSTQPLGWFKKPVTKAEDFKGLKFRTNGLAIDLFTAMGAAATHFPAAKSCRPWIAACSTVPSSTMPRPIASWASPMSPRSACCRAITRAPRPSRSASTRPSTTHCRKR